MTNKTAILYIPLHT